MAKKDEKTVEAPSLEDKLSALMKENEARVAQVQQYNEHITQLRDEITKSKEAHDYCRGQIELLQSLIAEKGQ